ncbi:MAG: hypothetical protein HQM08_17380 [Candidatus Riflebacteria bacterium]|nr:hypothetical protein [Candidatus Riflebacteria bacterium]
MRKLLILSLLFFLFLLPLDLGANPTHWEHPTGSKYTSQAWPLPTAVAPTNGFKTVATPTISVVASHATVIGTMPTGANEVEVSAFDGNINYGGSTVSSTTYNAYIASGSSKTFNLATTTPGIYLIMRTATSTDMGSAGFLAK